MRARRRGWGVNRAVRVGGGVVADGHHGGMVKRDTVREAQLPRVTLPELRPYDGQGLEPDGDYDGLLIEDADLAGTQASGATFMDCGIRRCTLDEASLGSARLFDSVLEGVRGVGVRLAGAQLRDVELRDARLGGTQLHGARLNRVLVRGGKFDYLNLRQARLADVVFEGCVLVEPDLSGAALERVAFRDCALRRAELNQVRMKEVDLRGATELDIVTGVEHLSGAVISTGQLMDLAPAFAAHLGVRVEF
ncbi:hypothetical protein SCA03_52400 [Streptomyces cacaoi]|uniref:Pentapeptide repeat-containing protein n=2 Tax=Streptomyces cacaoi TaxID=1898 RepID=A0A4Y3R5S4_STRCI|nr:hypothetical protein SCA03_52400 [Streptomyces cacaoi]